MATKGGIIEQIGESGLLLPEIITRGLAANDRLKYYLTLLQSACDHATDAARQARPNLRVERQASGVIEATLDYVVESTTYMGGDIVHIPGSASIVGQLFDELRLMLRPLQLAGAAHPELRSRFDLYQRRFEDLVAHSPGAPDDQLSQSAIVTLANASGNGHDTLRQLAIDLQWELNRLQSSVSRETIDGATVYNITDADRVLIRAFMRGLNQTAGLKFDHPGLGTAATREGEQLSIQNDLGSTDDHVLVLHVARLTVTLNYTDVHRQRVQFLRKLLQSFDVKWTTAEVPAGAGYELSVGQYSADLPEGVERFLAFLGSRLVFLIDWNRARKRIARLVGNSEAVSLLTWAAENNIGHCAFLQAGDIRMIEQALERAAASHARPGSRLDELMGKEGARLFLMAVFRTTSSGLAAGRSLRLIEDEIEAELLRYLQTTDGYLLKDAGDHASAIEALTEGLQRELVQLNNAETSQETRRSAQVAQTWSARADEIVVRARRASDHDSDGHALRRLLTEADVAADSLEEVAFLLTLTPAVGDTKALALLAGLADYLTTAARQYVRCLEEGRDLTPASPRSDVDTFLVRVDQIAQVVRQATAAKRAITERLLRGANDFHNVYVLTNAAAGFERAAASLARCGVIVRDYVLSARLTR